jgi:hypothetical protein
MSPSEKKAASSAPQPTPWVAEMTRAAKKQMASLPPSVYDTLLVLQDELRTEGPEQKEWPNYGRLKGQKKQKKNEFRYHCHLKKGHPTYVACWQVTGKSIEIDIYYTGTHENAPYNKK